jgi:peptidoglycan hydrolase CwlO-like protein
MDGNEKRDLLDRINMKKAVIYRVKADVTSAVQNVNAVRDNVRTAKARASKMQADFKAMKKEIPAKKDAKKAEALKAASNKYGKQGAKLFRKK